MNIMRVPVDFNSSTWIMGNYGMFCTHDGERHIEADEFSVSFYVCADCGEVVDGDPEYDRQELIAEAQLMEMLGK